MAISRVGYYTYSKYSNYYLFKEKIKNEDNSDYKPMSIKIMILLIILPIVIAVVPLAREVYVLYNCEYMVMYNYQEGVIDSVDTNYAILDNKPIKLSLDLLKFDREGVKMSIENVHLSYTDAGIEVKHGNLDSSENSDIEKIAMDALDKCSSAKSAEVDFIPEAKYAIITLMDGEDGGTILGTYFYYDNGYVQSIDNGGDLERVLRYK